MRVPGQPHGREHGRYVARSVSAVTVAVVLVVGLGGVPQDDGSLGTAPPTNGFPAGEAYEVDAAPPWWRSGAASDRPSGEGSESAMSTVSPGEGSESAMSTVSPGEGSESAMSTVGPGEGSGQVVDPVDAEPLSGPDWVRRTEEGFEVSRGTSRRGSGAVVTYTVERESAVGTDLLALTAAVEEALHDPRSWSRDHTLERVEDPAAADIRVLLATPSTVDRLCAETGLDTEGRYSCWNGTFAAMNAGRWRQGAPDFDELTTYRRYLVNHEFGHGLGHGHLECPAPGAPAPVMMQQTIGTAGCEANPWPYPDTSGD